jgi:hypothetical protein
MHRLCVMFLVALTLIRVNSSIAAPLVSSDFRQGLEGWARRGSARLTTIGEVGREQVVQLTNGNSNYQAGVVWTELRRRVPSFSFIADVRVRSSTRYLNSCPADGFTLVFAPVETDAIGTFGGALALANNDQEIRQFIALEVNTWYGQGLGTPAERNNCTFGKHETFAFDVLTPAMARTEEARTAGGGTPEKGGFKIGQVTPPQGLQIVDGGWYRYQWNVAADGTMTAFVSGLDPDNQRFQKVKVLEVKMAWSPLNNFDGRWGVTGGTGGYTQTTELSRVIIESPMIAPQ